MRNMMIKLLFVFVWVGAATMAVGLSEAQGHLEDATSSATTRVLSSGVGANIPAKPSLLRRAANENLPQKQRSLLSRILASPTNIVLNALVDAFIPALTTEIGGVVDGFDPVNANYETLIDMGNVSLNFNNSFCNQKNATAVIVYKIGNTAGLSTMKVNDVTLVDGTEDINIPPAAIVGRGTTTWAGDWKVDASVNRFVADTTATLQTSFCNFTFETILNGTATLVSPTLSMRVRLEGETGNIYNFNEESQLNAITFKDFDIGYASFTPSLGTFGGLVTQDANGPLTAYATRLQQDLKTQIRNDVQAQVNRELPYKL